MDMLTISAHGHPNILSRHQTTWQLTMEADISKRADCIIGVRADLSCNTLPEWLTKHLKEGGTIKITINVGEHEYHGEAQGHHDLTFTNPIDMVFRKSDYVCPRTVAIRSSFTAASLPRPMVAQLKDPNTTFYTVIELA